jgi:hypothetical protein
VLQFLHQDVPGSAGDVTLEELWQWAIKSWDKTRLHAIRTRSAPAEYLGG